MTADQKAQSMRVGFASIFAWRPHVEHLIWLARNTRAEGHEVFFLTCDAKLSSCYSRELRPDRAAFRTCTACTVGGVRSFENNGVESLWSFSHSAGSSDGHGRELAASSAATIGRFETMEDFQSQPFEDIVRRLEAPCEFTYHAAREWIARNKLDAICIFNGRMDITRALFDAAVDSKINVVTMERTWFGDGLQLFSGENCLGLSAVDDLMDAWRERPLTQQQAERTAVIIATRFKGGNEREWRAYNRGAKIAAWPGERAGHRLLLVPGSLNELYGHPDWKSIWPTPTAAYDALIDHLGVDPTNIVLRCHPNWSERIGLADGSKSETFFSQWAREKGVHLIGSSEIASTQSLMDQADAIVVGGSSAGLEGGVLGKRVIAISPSIYQRAGFQTTIYSRDDLERVDHTILDVSADDSREIARRALRFAHTMIYRVSQFVENVRCVTTTKYRYSEPADFGRFIRLLQGGRVEADDDRHAATEQFEDIVLGRFERRDWDALLADMRPLAFPDGKVQRRPFFRAIDVVRDRMVKGDQ